jgi:para-nitrobenzyl esterase
LNVWTPSKSRHDGIPVLVWIYGGGFNAGATSEPNYSGEKLAQRGVVLVSIAYRVGRLGFLAHPDLSAESRNHVSGNYGLLDMIAGLQWVRKNIGAFGGDPHRVTIFGESAGGIAVSMLCASPLAKGLFQGAISQSGGSFGPPRPTTFPGENLKRLPDAERSGEAYAKAAGASSIAELRKLPADKLQAGGRGMGLAWPLIDGWVIPDDQYKLYEAKRYNDTPILVGYNSDEGASFSPPKTPEEYVAAVKGRYGPFADKLISAYPPGSGTVAKTARDLTRDAAFGWHTWIWARLEAQSGKSKVFYYCFDQHPEYPADSPRAGYGSPHLLDELRQARRSERRRRSRVARLQRRKTCGDVLRADTPHGTGSQRRSAPDFGRIFHMAAHAGRGGLGQVVSVRRSSSGEQNPAQFAFRVVHHLEEDS